jgi:hypothetical protein
MGLTLLIPDETRARVAEYLASLRAGSMSPGKRLEKRLAESGSSDLTARWLLAALLDTKVPKIFAESEVSGDGSDWNLTELGILGDISIGVPVTVFDNGHHTAPVPHDEPFHGTLFFTPGALLRNDRGLEPADWAEVTLADGNIDRAGYQKLYERRLLPVFRHANESAAAVGKHALLTIPGLGCGQFAGPFAGKLGIELQTALEGILERHGPSFPRIRAVYFDPYAECSNQRREIHGISLMVRPLKQGNAGKSQLCPPSVYAEDGDDFSDCLLFSIVAWDHVSWPGNDFFGGSRSTDDGVKAAATDSMAVVTGYEGHYDPQRNAYLPPPPYRTWTEVVERNGLRLDPPIPI